VLEDIAGTAGWWAFERTIDLQPLGRARRSNLQAQEPADKGPTRWVIGVVVSAIEDDRLAAAIGSWSPCPA